MSREEIRNAFQATFRLIASETMLDFTKLSPQRTEKGWAAFFRRFLPAKSRALAFAQPHRFGAKRQRRRIGTFRLWAAVAVLAVAVGVLSLQRHGILADGDLRFGDWRLREELSERLPVVIRPGSTSSPTLGNRFAECGWGARRDCVVDGDTFWFEGQKIRLADIDAPELFSPSCAREAELAERAKQRLVGLLNTGALFLTRAGPDVDKYGRKLRIVLSRGQSIGDILVTEGLAQHSRGRKARWC